MYLSDRPQIPSDPQHSLTVKTCYSTRLWWEWKWAENDSGWASQVKTWNESSLCRFVDNQMTEFVSYSDFWLLCFLCWWRWVRTASWPQTIKTTLTTTTTATITQWASSSTTTCVWKWLCGSSCTRRASYDCTCTSEFRLTRNDNFLHTSYQLGNMVTGSPKMDGMALPASSQDDCSWLSELSETKKSFLFIKKTRIFF